MGKFYETTSTFSYTWEQIVKAFWKRYPNPFNSNILSEDTICREIRGDQLYSRRLITKKYRLPKWAEKFGKCSQVPVVEESYINPEKKTATTYTRNVGYNRFLSVTEKVTYTPDPSNPTETIAHRSAWIQSSVYGLRRAVEKFGMERFHKNCAQTLQGFNFVLRRLYPKHKSLQHNTTGTDPEKDEVAKRRFFARFTERSAPFFSINADASPNSNSKS